jgi:predicted oxidoreductase
MARLILGTMRFGSWGAHLNAEQVAERLAAAAAMGFDTLDLADIYGDHQTNALIGAAFRLDGSLKGHFKLIAKAGIVLPQSPGNSRGVQYYDASVAHLDRALQQTLHDLGVEQVDSFLLHRPDYLLQLDPLCALLDQWQQRGQCAKFGLSNASPTLLQTFARRRTIVANQIELSLLRTAALDDGSLATCQLLGTELQAWSPLAGGHWQSNDALRALLDQTAHDYGLDHAGMLLRWLACIPNVSIVLGSSDPARWQAAMQAMKPNKEGAPLLPRDLWYALLAAARGHAVP